MENLNQELGFSNASGNTALPKRNKCLELCQRGRKTQNELSACFKVCGEAYRVDKSYEDSWKYIGNAEIVTPVLLSPKPTIPFVPTPTPPREPNVAPVDLGTNVDGSILANDIKQSDRLASENESSTDSIAIIGIGLVLVSVVGYLIYKKKQ